MRLIDTTMRYLIFSLLTRGYLVTVEVFDVQSLSNRMSACATGDQDVHGARSRL